MEALAAILVELRRNERLAERRGMPGVLLEIAVALTFCSIYPHWLADEIFREASRKKLGGEFYKETVEHNCHKFLHER